MEKRILRYIIYAMWGALLFGSTFVLKALPNIHLLALFIIVLTRIYRMGALIPIYIYVFLEGVLQGFSPWWVPYLYIWTVLWAVAMLIPKKTPEKVCAVCFPILGFLHGMLFGTLWAPFQALVYGLSLEGAVAWIISGIPFDIIHGASNACACTLAIPLIRMITKLEQSL